MMTPITVDAGGRVARDFSARLSYVYRREVDRYQTVNVLRPSDAFSIPITGKDPGPDGVLNTGDDGAAVTYYDYTAAFAGAAFVRNMDVNTPGHENGYHSVEVAAQKRLSSKWQLVTSFLATRVDTWRNGIPQDPNAANHFPKSKYWEWDFKASGSYELPWGLVRGRRASRSRVTFRERRA